jgi:hypothetical protein
MELVAFALACEPGMEKITPNIMKKPHSGNPGFRKMGLAQITAALLAASFSVDQLRSLYLKSESSMNLSSNGSNSRPSYLKMRFINLTYRWVSL